MLPLKVYCSDRAPDGEQSKLALAYVFASKRTPQQLLVHLAGVAAMKITFTLQADYTRRKSICELQLR